MVIRAGHELQRLRGAGAAAARAAARAGPAGRATCGAGAAARGRGGRLGLVVPLVRPPSASSAAWSNWYSSTYGLSSFSRAWISLRFSSRKSAI